MKTKLQKRNFAKLLKLNKELNKSEMMLETMDFRIDGISYKQLDLKEMQKIVGGSIQVHPEIVRINNKIFDLIVNEEGWVNELPFNQMLYDMFNIEVAGTVILLEGGLK